MSGFVCEVWLEGMCLHEEDGFDYAMDAEDAGYDFAQDLLDESYAEDGYTLEDFEIKVRDMN